MRNWQQRSGVWVACGAGVGIRILERVAVKKDGSRRLIGSGEEPAKDEIVVREPWIHITNSDGTTLAQLPESSAGKVRQAKRAEIPAARIAEQTDEQLTAMGYV